MLLCEVALDVLNLFFEIQAIFLGLFLIFRLSSIFLENVHEKTSNVLYFASKMSLVVCAAAMIPFFAVAVLFAFAL